MGMTEFAEELEMMATNAMTAQAIDTITHADICQWRRLFNFSTYNQAMEEILNYSQDLTKQLISESHWSTIETDKVKEGYDRLSYSYFLDRERRNCRRLQKSTRRPSSTKPSNSIYVLKLEGPINTAARIQEIADLHHPPKTHTGIGEDNTAEFCTVNSEAYSRVVRYLEKEHPYFNIYAIRQNKAPKDLSSISHAPILGHDAETTLPQHRLGNPQSTPRPTQTEYPVWYFVYGNLAKPAELQSRLNLSTAPTYTPARVYGGTIKRWRDKYNALIDASADSVVEGQAFLVTCEDHEDILRFYETEKYEVVRCDIHMEGRVQRGLVFRYAGAAEDLN